MPNLIKWLEGKKTKLFLLGFFLTILAEQATWIDSATSGTIQGFFLTGAGFSMRHAIEKVK